MKLHLSPEFIDAITATSAHLKIREAYIEKDYWVTFVLNNLSKSEFNKKVVFKGGTSLSKVYKCIERFSEDIDLAILENENLGDSRRKALMKDIEKTITVGLVSMPDFPLTEKRGRNRKTFFHYNNVVDKKQMGPVKDLIQLEINSFTEPVPFGNATIETFITQFLRETGRNELIDLFELAPFELNVLSMERTFFEKILSLVRLSYEGPDALKSKIRHFYDIAKIFQKNSSMLESKASVEIFNIALNDDRKNSTFAGVWLEKPLSEAILFKDFKSLWKQLEPTYRNDLKDLLWVESMPTNSEISEVMQEIEKFLRKL